MPINGLTIKFFATSGNISPIPSILLTPFDAIPLNAPVASGATTVGRTVLAKKAANAPRNPPFLL